MEKRYNFRIYPNKTQHEQIQKNFGCCRFVYNYFLDKRIKAFENGEGILSYNSCSKELTAMKKTDEYSFLREADAGSLQYSIKCLDLAFKSFFRNIKQGTAPGFPKFKSKRETYKSYKSVNHTKTNEVRFKGDKIILPKLGAVKCRISKHVEGRIISASVVQASSEIYYVSVCYTEVEQDVLPYTDKIVGLHLGINNLAVISDGQKFENPKYLEKSLKKIARLQRELSRKTSGSKNFEKARIKLSREYEHITNQKNDSIQKLTTDIVRNYDVICISDVEVKNKLKRDNKRNSFRRNLADSGWGLFTKCLTYKSEWYGKKLVIVDNTFPSVQLCGCCDYKNTALNGRTNIDEWTCPNCNTTHDRSVNAARNILTIGMEQISIA